AALRDAGVLANYETPKRPVVHVFFIAPGCCYTVADTNESKELLKFCRKFTVPLRAALRDAGVLANYETPKRPVVHVFFIAPGCCYT
ncbi:hypothetical protein CQA18_27035, partial [Enterobacter hormaechei]